MSSQPAEPVRMPNRLTAVRTAPVELALLAGFGLRGGGLPVRLPPAGQRLAAYVALQDRPVRRSQVAFTLWGEGAGALRTALWRVGHACPGLIDATATHVSLGRDVAVDVLDGIRFSRTITNTSADMLADGELVLRCLSADLLPDWCDDWLVLARERWRQLRLHALEALAMRFAAAGRHGLAVESALTAIEGDALRESAHRCLIRVHLMEGNRAEAMRAYLRLCRLLDRELGVEPGEDVRALVAHLPVVRKP